MFRKREDELKDKNYEDVLKYNVYDAIAIRALEQKDKLDYCEKCKNGLLLKEDKKSPSFTTRPTVIEWKNDYECFITLTEGKFHEVRRIFETLGNCVIILKRISFYNYDLGTLKEGKIKKL